MPKFLRPGILIKGNPYASDNITERYEEMMQYDLIDEQEKTNKLMKEKINSILELNDSVKRMQEENEAKMEELEEQQEKARQKEEDKKAMEKIKEQQEKEYDKKADLCIQYKISYDMIKQFLDYVEANEILEKSAELHNQINTLNDEQYDFIETDDYEIETVKVKDNSEQIKVLENKISEITKERSQVYYQRLMDFIEFRKNHYNEDLETLFHLLQLPIFIIDQKDIKNKGTRSDYIEYMSKKLSQK